MRQSFMASSVVLMVTMATMAVVPSAWGMQVDVPLPIVVAQSDLIVVGEVVQVGGPTKMKLQVPGWKRAGERYWRRYEIVVREVLRDPHKALTPAAPATRPADKVRAKRKGPRKIGVLTMAMAPGALVFQADC